MYLIKIHLTHIWIVFMVSYRSLEYEFKCPDSQHRSHRIRIICRWTPTKYKHYSCLFNQLNNTYEESCSKSPDFVRPGEKYVISGIRKNVNCIASRYQPFKFWSHSSSECKLSKSLCSELGQVLYHNGSTVNDRNCTCDHTNGYALLKIVVDPYPCRPTEEDCTCYKKSCQLSNFHTPDFKCNISSWETSFTDETEQRSQKKTKLSVYKDPIGEELYIDDKRKASRQTHRLVLTFIISALVFPFSFLTIFCINMELCTDPDMHEFSRLEDFVKYIGIQEFYPNRLQIRDVMKLQFSTVPLASKDIALMFAKDIIMNNFKGRDTLIDERLTKDIIMNNFKGRDTLIDERLTKDPRCQRDYSSANMLQWNYSNNKTINPLDLTICIFQCSSPMLKTTLALKLFMCKLAIPFIFPKYNDDNIKVSLSILHFRSIVLEKPIENASISTMILQCPCQIVSLVRIGKISFSKSMIANTILNKYYHDTFFNRDCPLGTSRRRISMGLVETAWYVPSHSGKQDNFRMFLNLRGDGQDYQDRLNTVTSLSSICIIMIKIDNLKDEQCLKCLENVHDNDAGVILAIDGKGNDKKAIYEKIDCYKQCITKYKEKTRFSILNFGEEIICLDDMKQDIENKISELKNSKLLSSIYERIQDKKQSTDEDERTIVKVREEVQKLKECFSVSTVDLKLTVQCKDWESWSQFFKLKSSRIVQAAARKGEIVDERVKQEYLCEKHYHFIKTFISSFWDLNESENESQVYVLLVQCLLDERDREIITQYKADVPTNKSAKEEENACHKPEISKIMMHNKLFGLKHIYRFMGNMFAALTECVSERQNMQKYLKILPKLAATQLRIGQPFELMNGEVGKVPIIWIKAVFSELNSMLGERKCLVLSVLGIQGSGKTTLLNTMFGLHYAVTADRCKKGVYFQLFDELNSSSPFDSIIVIEVEGLGDHDSVDRMPRYDNDLVTFAVGICDIAIVNIKGENTMDIKNVLQTVVKFMLKQNLTNNTIHTKKKCIFTHQNVNEDNDKMRHKRQISVNILDEMTSTAATEEGVAGVKTFNQVIQSNLERDVWYFSGFWFGQPPMAPVNPGYSKTAADLRDAIFNIIDRKMCLTITNILTRIEDIWKVI